MWRRALAAAFLIAASAAALAPYNAGPRPAAAAPRLKIVFAALERDSEGRTGGLQALYVANGDGTNVARLTPPDDGMYYDWPMWSADGSKILYTARYGQAGGGSEPIFMMDVAKSQIVQLTHNNWRNAQPKPSMDGKSVLFTSLWPEFPVAALYRLSLITGEVENLSVNHAADAGFDSDPFWTADGKRIVFASSRNEQRVEQPTQIYVMDADGAGRRRLTNDQFFNTDPSLSPDGRYVTISSYRGEGRPALEGGVVGDFTNLRLFDWPLVVKDTVTGEERKLTEGKECGKRDLLNPCQVSEGSAWVPKWTPDGKQIGFISIMSPNRSGIYVINPDGSNARPLIETADKAITWFDWTWDMPPDPAFDLTPPPAASALLFGGQVYDSLGPGAAEPQPQLFLGAPDRWYTTPVVPAAGGIVPEGARLSPDRQHILFSARPAAKTAAAADGDTLKQVFVMAADGGNVRQVTGPALQDALEPLGEGEQRSNTDPDLSPDGRYLLVTNTAEDTGVSWLLRLDFHTGEVLNLTSVTRGPYPGVDERARFAPDASQIAFVSLVEGVRQLFLMSPDGQRVRQLTDDTNQNLDPAWSPDGRWLVYASQRPSAERDASGRPRLDWHLMKINVETGEQTAIAGGNGFEALRPVWSPDGKRIAYIATTGGQQPDIYVVDAAGGSPRPLQVTLRTKELFVDWR